MRTTQQLSVTLSNEQVALVQKKVESGEYASVSEVIREGLRSLERQNAAVERWLREDVARSYDRYQQNPESVIPLDQVLSRIEARYAADHEG